MKPTTGQKINTCSNPIYSDCVLWSGGNLACINLISSCTDATVTSVIKSIGNGLCNISGTTTTIISSITYIQDNSNLSGLTWGCTTSGTTNSVTNSFQAVVNELNTQKVSYASSQFTITGSDCSSRTLAINTPSWTSFSFIRSTTTNINHTPSVNEGYLVDILGNVRLTGSFFDITSAKNVETVFPAASGTGYYLPVCEIPTVIIPTAGRALRTKFFLDCYIQYVSGDTTFYDSGNVTRVDISATTSTSYIQEYKRIIPATLLYITPAAKWYLCVDKQYLPGGVNRSSALLIQDSTVRVYIDGATYNINN